MDLAAAQETTNEIVATLAQRHVELAQSHAELAGAHKELAQAQKATEEALNSLISVMERHIAGHN